MQTRGTVYSPGQKAACEAIYSYTKSSHNWDAHHIKKTPAKLVGFTEDVPDERTAIARAVMEYRVPRSERGRLVARRRD